MSVMRVGVTAGPGRVMPVTNDTLSRSRRESRLVDDSASDTAERLMMTEKLIRELNETWEEKIRKSEEIRRQRYNYVRVAAGALISTP